MSARPLSIHSVLCRPVFFATCALLLLPCIHAQQPQSLITMEKSSPTESAARTARAFSSPAEEKSAAQKENYREFTAARSGQSPAAELFSLQFHGTTRVTGFSATGDFHVTGGTCIEGHTYIAGDRCNLEVEFTPQGPGHRSGQLSVAHSASATPFLSPIGGTAYAPAVSFVPSQIQTVPGTLSGSTGTLLSPGGLAVDGGGSLYIPDTGNHLLKKRDSSGVISTLVGGGTTSLTTTASGYGPQIKLNLPNTVVVDYSGTVYFGDSGDKLVASYFIDNIAIRSIGLGAMSMNACSTSAKCTPSSVAIGAPESLAVDPSGNVYLSLLYGNGLPGTLLAEWTPDVSPVEFYTLGSTAYNYYSSSFPVSVDPSGYGNLYYTYDDPGGPILSPTPLCYILGQNSAYSNNQAGARDWILAGSGTCGFSGDGGNAIAAEIGKIQGQFAWDPAGNFYFTDTSNNRVRRIDGLSGVIRTVAGSGANGFGGDGGPSTAAQLQSPFGLAVDSTGQVYVTGTAVSGITSAAPNVPTDIRSFGTVGALNFGGVAQGSRSAAQTVLLSNVGNVTLNFSHAAFTSGNTSDFAIDPNTTTCNFTGLLESGHSCNIGFIFTPAAQGTRTAVLTITDDTASGQQTVVVTGSAVGSVTLTPAAISFPTTTVGAKSSAVSATLSNTGSSAVTISAAPAFTGTNPTSFLETTTCGSSLGAGASCTISIVFAPQSAGTLTATLVVKDTAGNGQQTISLSGAGAGGSGTVSLSPASLAFPSTTVGSLSAAQVVTFSNTTSAAISVKSFVFGGTNGSSFAIASKTCGTSLAAGATCTLSLVFRPTATGSLTGTFSASDSAANTPQVVTLAGPAVAAAVKSKVALATASNPVPQGESALLRSQVTDATGASAGITGVVQLEEGGKVLAAVKAENGTATFSLSTLAPGTHQLTAVYMGDPKHTGAASPALTQMVSVPATVKSGLDGPRKVRIPLPGPTR